jgi:hypothetical protein
MFKLHRCRYKIIGSGIEPDSIWIETDLICPKCGRTGTVYVNRMCEDKLLHQAVKHKYFSIPKDFVIPCKRK